jgi:hypothetical protein
MSSESVSEIPWVADYSPDLAMSPRPTLTNTESFGMASIMSLTQATARAGSRLTEVVLLQEEPCLRGGRKDRDENVALRGELAQLSWVTG